MDGVLITHTDTRHYFYIVRCMLLVGENTDYRHSYLHRPQREEAYGDKDVSHWKMEGSVKPLNIRDAPWDWELYEVWPEDYRNWYVTSIAGSDYCYCEAHRQHYSTGYIYNAYKTEWRIVDASNGEKKVQERLMYYSPNGYDVDWSDKEDLFPWVDVGFQTTNGTWRSAGRWEARNTTFDAIWPLPYYWLDHMKDIKPFEPRDVEALSEVIRNVIAENTSYNTNNYANFLEVLDLIRDFRNGKFGELIEDTKDFYKLAKRIAGHDVSKKEIRSLVHSTPDVLSKGWLKYRYAYTTTKADVDQYTRAKVGEFLGALDESRVLRGKIDILDGELRVKMRLHDDTSPNFTKILIGLEQYGLYPGLYNLWDLMPWSFVADWGSHLGDYLEDLDQSIFFHYYKVDELLVSEKRRLDRDEPWGLTHYTWYERYLLHEMPQWEIYEEGNASNKTLVKRTIDALALTVSSL